MHMNLYSIDGIRDILKCHGFRFSKSLGQNFLADRNICMEIAAASALRDEFGVLEIGAGLGGLTRPLSNSAAKVCTVEIDRALSPILNETIGDLDNVRIVYADIMKTDLNALVEDEFPGLRRAVCANLPYYITSPVLVKLIESRKFEMITVMLQKEVAERICAKPASPEYGAFSLFVQYHTEPSILFTVPPSSFVPPPKVESAVIQLKMREISPVNIKDEALFFRIIRASFTQRRKLLVNSLHSLLREGFSKQELSQMLSELGMPENVRGETLGLGEFAKICNFVHYRISNKN